MACSSDTGLLKILCIHGYRQSSQAFRERTGAFRKIIKKQAELVFIDAPNIVPALPETGEQTSTSKSTAEQRGWWFSRADDFFKAEDPTECVKGYDDSLDAVRHAFIQHGPFDGLLGFSQGASLVSLICALQQQGEWAHPFYFAVLVAGFESRSVQHRKLYDVKVEIPTLHVFGDTDAVIEKDMSKTLLEHYSDATRLDHPGGHFIPATSAQKRVYLDFFSSQLDAKGNRIEQS